MRTTATAPDRRGDPESGVGATIVVLVLFVLFGVGALAIDVGAAWALRRDLDAAVESAALAGARVGTEVGCDEDDIEDEVDRLLTANGADPANKTLTVDCDNGVVTVGTSEQSFQLFSPIFNRSIASPNAAAAEIGGPARSASGLRPIGMCVDEPAYQLWQRELQAREAADDRGIGGTPRTVPWTTTDLAGTYDVGTDVSIDGRTVEIVNDVYPSATGPVFRSTFGRLSDLVPDSDCLDSPVAGSWGWLSFGNNGNSLESDIRDGSSRTVQLEDPDANLFADCDEDDAGDQDCGPQTGGQVGNVDDALEAIACAPDETVTECNDDGRVVFILGLGDSGGNGNNATFAPESFIGIVVRCPSGPGGIDCPRINGNLSADDYIDIEFVDEVLVTGTPGGTPVGDPLGANAPGGLCANATGVDFCRGAN